MGNLAKDTTELDLWAFDDAEPDENTTAETQPTETVVPSPRPPDRLKVRKLNETTPPKRSESKQRTESKKNRIRSKSTTSGPSTPSDEFDDLDHWEDTEPAAEVKDISEGNAAEPPEPISVTESSTPESSLPPREPEPAVAEKSAPAIPDEKPASDPLHLRLNLTKTERIGLISLLAILVFGAASILIYSLGRLPTESAGVKSTDFPIKGKIVHITAAETHWREPIIEGKSPDIVRRGTALLPVIDLATSNGAAAIRVIFRNDDGESVGDIVTRSVQDGQKLEIAATAGFDDLGMHAAYRTGESKPWTVEVFEAPTVDSSNNDFNKLFQMNISTDRR